MIDVCALPQKAEGASRPAAAELLAVSPSAAVRPVCQRRDRWVPDQSRCARSIGSTAQIQYTGSVCSSATALSAHLVAGSEARIDHFSRGRRAIPARGWGRASLASRVRVHACAPDELGAAAPIDCWLERRAARPPGPRRAARTCAV
jgi:hypothetical protein